MPLPVQLDFRSGVPSYIQIMDQIKHLVANGELKAGDQLPTVRQLAADLRLNFNTVARAYRLLDEAGVISTQHGRGTYILADESGHDLEALKQEALLALTRSYIEQAIRLGLQADEVRRAFEQELQRWDKSEKPDE